MSYRSLLVLLDRDPLCTERVRVAIRLAARLDIHLVGIAPTGNVRLPVAPESAISMAEFAEIAREALRDEAAQAVQAFRDACRDAGARSFEALIDEADPAQSMVRNAHFSDLAVLTQADPAAANHRAVQDLVEQVALHSARPTLVLPYAGRFDTLGSQVLVAWDDSREAARALSDALPLLRGARKVHVIAWNEAGGAPDETLGPRLATLHRWLTLHGVPAEVGVETTEIGIADAMLSRAADLDCDLIVMGAYGHARWTQRMLGGATRGLLASMTVPVLMSH